MHPIWVRLPPCWVRLGMRTNWHRCCSARRSKRCWACCTVYRLTSNLGSRPWRQNEAPDLNHTATIAYRAALARMVYPYKRKQSGGQSHVLPNQRTHRSPRASLFNDGHLPRINTFPGGRLCALPVCADVCSAPRLEYDLAGLSAFRSRPRAGTRGGYRDGPILEERGKLIVSCSARGKHAQHARAIAAC